MQVSDLKSRNSRWPHRWAIALACATFPLLWVGGLVTTTKAGMAVPDWPNTYGYNLFLYPWQSWLAAPWDLFIEHGHRLLASSVGMLTIGLLVVLMRTEERRWLRGLGVVALGLVIFQGMLGGMRVLFDERTLAMLHGCTGPMFFAVTIALLVFTSRTWQHSRIVFEHEVSGTRAGHIRRLATVTAILAYLQIVLGAVVRHVPIAAEPGTFQSAVRFHLFLAAILTLHIALVAWLVLRYQRHVRPLGGLALMLAALILVQLTLGAATWLVKFSVPSWASGWISAGSVSIQDGGWLQTHIITAHVATGSLILATSLALALYAQRLLPKSSVARQFIGKRLEAAV
jgi:heme a synthase